MQFYFILSLISSIIVVIFALMNAAPIPVNILFFRYELSLALIIFISTALGAVIAVLFGLVRQFKFKKQIKQLNTENQILEKENKKLQGHIDMLQAVKPSEPPKENPSPESKQSEEPESL